MPHIRKEYYYLTFITLTIYKMSSHILIISSGLSGIQLLSSTLLGHVEKKQ